MTGKFSFSLYVGSKIEYLKGISKQYRDWSLPQINNIYIFINNNLLYDVSVVVYDYKTLFENKILLSLNR